MFLGMIGKTEKIRITQRTLRAPFAQFAQDKQRMRREEQGDGAIRVV
jgi:hypothetical protein